MGRLIAGLAACLALMAASPVVAQSQAGTGAGGSASEAESRLPSWRQAVLDMADRDLRHPGWGARHAERNYQLATSLAEAEGLEIDDDVLWAAAYLHDWGGLEAFEVEGTPHQRRSVELAEPFLRDAGFPMEKWPRVQEAILEHVPGGQPQGAEAVVLRDADLVDFLGAEGIARLLASTGDRPDMDLALRWIEGFADSLPNQLTTPEARRLAEPRAAYMREFLVRLRAELPEGTQP